MVAEVENLILHRLSEIRGEVAGLGREVAGLRLDIGAVKATLAEHGLRLLGIEAGMAYAVRYQAETALSEGIRSGRIDALESRLHAVEASMAAQSS